MAQTFRLFGFISYIAQMKMSVLIYCNLNAQLELKIDSFFKCLKALNVRFWPDRCWM